MDTPQHLLKPPVITRNKPTIKTIRRRPRPVEEAVMNMVLRSSSRVDTLVDPILSEKESVNVIVSGSVIETGIAKEKEIETRVTVSTRFHLRSSHKLQIEATDSREEGTTPTISNDINNHLNGVSTKGSLNSSDIRNMAAIIELPTWLLRVVLEVITIVMKILQTAMVEITCQSLSTSK